MEPEGLLPWSQESAIGPYSAPDESNPHPLTLFPEIYLNIILPSMPRSSKYSLPFRLSKQHFVRISYLPHAH
jgi:hypothetical protein